MGTTGNLPSTPRCGTLRTTSSSANARRAHLTTRRCTIAASPTPAVLTCTTPSRRTGSRQTTPLEPIFASTAATMTPSPTPTAGRPATTTTPASVSPATVVCLEPSAVSGTRGLVAARRSRIIPRPHRPTPPPLPRRTRRPRPPQLTRRALRRRTHRLSTRLWCQRPRLHTHPQHLYRLLHPLQLLPHGPTLRPKHM